MREINQNIARKRKKAQKESAKEGILRRFQGRLNPIARSV
jgi:hypothetical protein